MTKMTLTTGQVIKGVAGRYTVKTEDGEILHCLARGILKTKGELYVGDFVSVQTSLRSNVIENVLPRKSMLVRPYVSNIDGIVIVIAPIPKPDFLLVDKLIISCVQQGIDAILCVNKSDMSESEELYGKVCREYGELAKIIKISTSDGSGIDELKDAVKGRYYCLAGQSAVGKSSLVNYMFGKQVMQVGELSEKSERGKNTTRHIEIITLEDGTQIADTCGFSMFEIPLFDPATLSEYYTDFDKYRVNCKFRGCTHTVEQCCGVKDAVYTGEIPKDRYERYVQLYNDFTQRWEKRYD